PIVDAVKSLGNGQTPAAISPSAGGLADAVLREMARGRLLRWAGVLAIVFCVVTLGVAMVAPNWRQPLSPSESWQVRTTLRTETPILSMAFSPDGRALASGCWDGSVRVLDISKAKNEIKLRGHLGPVVSVCFSPDGKTLASASLHDTRVRL